MFKNQDGNSIIYVKFLKFISLFIFSFFLLLFIYLGQKKKSKYSFFIEFNTANGIVIGTPIRMRGVSIGVIVNIQLKLNGVLVLAKINSSNIIIPKNSIIETTQTGLLNESVIDIMPLQYLFIYKENGPLSMSCDSSKIICSNMYMLGERGLNYDDLIRSTTRISQRFDDPSVFYLLYIFLQRSIESINNLSFFIRTVFDTCNIHSKQLSRVLQDDLFY